MFNHYHIKSTPLRFAPEVSCPPGPTPYERALDDLVGNDGIDATNACIRIGEAMEAFFDNDFIMTQRGIQAAREKFEELVEKAREALDAYERKLENIEERRKYGEL